MEVRRRLIPDHYYNCQAESIELHSRNMLIPLRFDDTRSEVTERSPAVDQLKINAISVNSHLVLDAIGCYQMSMILLLLLLLRPLPPYLTLSKRNMTIGVLKLAPASTRFQPHWRIEFLTGRSGSFAYGAPVDCRFMC